jgi:hypothetical protein
MSDVVCAILGGAGSLILALLCLILACPLLLLLKSVGEHLGIALSVFLAPLFYVPKHVRAACLVLLVIWVLWAHPLPFWLQAFAIAHLPVGLAYAFFSIDRYRSLLAHIVFLVFGIYGLYLCFLQSGRWSDSLFLQLLLTSLMFAAPAYFLRSMHRTYIVYEKAQEQRLRDAYARKVDRRLREGKAAPLFCLYLRGFMLDNLLGPPLSNWAVDGGRFTSGKPIIATDFSGFFNALDEVTLDYLESVLVRSSRKLGALITLGRPGEALGAGRVETEDASWKDTVARLMERATVIFVIPVDRPGTIWEIEYLVGKGYLNKTVFVIGPHTISGPSGALWDSARKKLRGVLSLPDYRQEAGFFMRGPTGEFVFVSGHWDNRGLIAVRRTRKSLMRLLNACHARG